MLLVAGVRCDGAFCWRAGSLFDCFCDISCVLEASRDGGCGGLCICVFLVLAGSVSRQINRKKEENMWRVANKMMYRYLFVL